MAYVCGVVNNVFFVRWIKVEEGDIGRVLKLLEDSRNRHARPLVYVGIVPAALEPPAESERKALAQMINDVLKSCSCIHLVLEGQGFRQAAMRTIAAGMFLLTGRRGVVMNHDSVEEALTRCEHLDTLASVILNSARSRKLLSD
jgi:hypothetical protein